ncbi:MAG: hypothetical protein ACPGOY_18355 [Rhodospirillaceae bacterium]
MTTSQFLDYIFEQYLVSETYNGFPISHALSIVFSYILLKYKNELNVLNFFKCMAWSFVHIIGLAMVLIIHGGFLIINSDSNSIVGALLHLPIYPIITLMVGPPLLLCILPYMSFWFLIRWRSWRQLTTHMVIFIYGLSISTTLLYFLM